MNTAPAEVLLVEDNLLDVELAKAAFDKARAHVRIHHAIDGIHALELLRGHDGARPLRPDMILLDLNMPRMDGRELLLTLKADPKLRRLPVLVFTSSKNESDVEAMYDMQASCYIVKPIDFTEFLELARALDQFWFRRVARAPRGAP